MGHYGSYFVYGPCIVCDRTKHYWIGRYIYMTLVYKYLSQRTDIVWESKEDRDNVLKAISEFEAFVLENKDSFSPEDQGPKQFYDFEFVSRVWKKIYDESIDPSLVYTLTDNGFVSFDLKVPEAESESEAEAGTVHISLIYEDGFVQNADFDLTLCICLGKDWSADDYFSETYPDIIDNKFDDKPDPRLTAFKGLVSDFFEKTKIPAIPCKPSVFSIS